MASRTLVSGGSAVACSCTPMRALIARASRTTSEPSTVALPASGSRRPSSISIVVVLPAPFGPSMPKTSPLSTLKLMPSTATRSP
jgi:hypothetical protein